MLHFSGKKANIPYCHTNSPKQWLLERSYLRLEQGEIIQYSWQILRTVWPPSLFGTPKIELTLLAEIPISGHPSKRPNFTGLTGMFKYFQYNPLLWLRGVLGTSLQWGKKLKLFSRPLWPPLLHIHPLFNCIPIL